MKKKLITAAAALLLTATTAYANGYLVPVQPRPLPPAAQEAPPQEAPPPGPELASPSAPPMGWVFGPYTTCVPPNQQCFVQVSAAGVNVRQWPDGPTFAALVNGTPLIVNRSAGPWLLVNVPCPLWPTWLWSWTAGVQLLACGGF